MVTLTLSTNSARELNRTCAYMTSSTVNDSRISISVTRRGFQFYK